MATLTPSAMIELPRPSAGKLSPSGLHFAQSSSTFDTRTRRTSKNIVVGRVPAAGPPQLSSTSDSKDAPRPSILLQDLRFAELVWADDNTLLFLRMAGGATNEVNPGLTDAEQRKVWSNSASEDPAHLEVWAKEIHSKHEYVVGTLPVDDASDFKIHHVSPFGSVLAFSARVYGSDRSIYKASEAAKKLEEEKEGSTGQVYDKLFIRHWDHFLDSSIKQIHVVKLKKTRDGDTGSVHSLHSSDSEDSHASNPPESWCFDGDILSPMSHTTLESPVGPFGGEGDFDISATHLVFTAKDPNLPPAWHTRQNIYLLPICPRSADDAQPKCLTHQVGATSCPTFSPEHKHAAVKNKTLSGTLAWLEMRKDGYEADRNRVMVHHLATGKTEGVTEAWDRSPGSLVWSEDAHELFLLAEDHARVKCFRLDLRASGDKPQALTSGDSVSSVAVVPTPVTQSDEQANQKKKSPVRLLLSTTSHVSPTKVSVADFEGSHQTHVQELSALAQPYLDKLQPALKPAEEFCFDGAQTKVHGWIMYPPTFPADAESIAKEEGKWPMAFLIHGGPQGSWANSWSTRWNPAVFASQGYITVAIDPTGSTGYGQAFTDAIQGQWGGLPYKDLVAGYQHVLKHYKAIDPQRTAALGASYGGYMVNWMQGHNVGFKALVCHDGVFDTETTWYETEELYFPEHENCGFAPYENPELYSKWSPKNHVLNFATPQLIIHGGKDYRLPETQGIAMFNALQRRGVASRLLYFPEENHWVLNPLNSRKWHEEVFKWLSEWV